MLRLCVIVFGTGGIARGRRRRPPPRYDLLAKIGHEHRGPKYLPPQLKTDIRGRLQDKVMFGSDYPSIPYERLFREWKELGYSDAMMEKLFHGNAERILGL